MSFSASVAQPVVPQRTRKPPPDISSGFAEVLRRGASEETLGVLRLNSAVGEELTDAGR